MRSEGKSFKYTTVFTNFGERTYHSTIKDGSGADIVVYKHSSYKTKSVAKQAQEDGITELEAFYKYIDSICTTENAQTSIRTRVREATDEDDNLYSIEYYPVSGRNKGKLTTIIDNRDHCLYNNVVKSLSTHKNGIRLFKYNFENRFLSTQYRYAGSAELLRHTIGFVGRSYMNQNPTLIL